MWSRAFKSRLTQAKWRPPHRLLQVRRRNDLADGPHTTYFQPPPQPRKFWKSFIWGSTWFALGGITLGTWAYFWVVPELEGELEEIHQELHHVNRATFDDSLARDVPSFSLGDADSMLGRRANMLIGDDVIGHMCQVPSNTRCEDEMASADFSTVDGPKMDWTVTSIFDGHAGPRTATALAGLLTSHVCNEVTAAGYLRRPYTPNDRTFATILKRAFLHVDDTILNTAREVVNSATVPNSVAVSMAAPAFSGSCALMVLFDPNNSVLRVANVGDSRAVLGRWDDDAQTYVAKPMSVDHKGFNPDELSRIQQEHPGEDVVDPKTGRVHGIAITRAFGDSRWKWTEAVTRRAHEVLWGPAPRPHGVIKTPPYLTAEPDVTEARIQTGRNPDFLIMASDGLWDVMSSEDAVECVRRWLAKFRPTDALEQKPVEARKWEFQNPPSSPGAPPGGDEDDADLFYDPDEKCLKWRVSPEHFVVEDPHCGVHLIRNALGGSRRNLFASIMTVQPPLSREMRDDITVSVLFFGTGSREEIMQAVERERAAR